MKRENGKVYIVGAGPGDPGLITVKGLDKLKEADVVVYDRLINNDLLSYCRDDSEKIFVGKESGYHPVEQDRITEILIIKSRLGLNVVRLKGGNPFVFGRGSEEAMGLRNAGVDFEIIPGITSGLSAPVYGGIPITHRGMISQCVLITAHESPDKPGTQVEWDKLARLKNTSLVIYMGASRIEKICQELIRNGADPSTPSAVIENGTLPTQRTLTARLDHLAQEFKEQDFHAPAIIMISPTVAMRDQILWYEKKPLFGKRIVAAGYDFQLKRLRSMVYDLGGEVIPLHLSDPAQLAHAVPGDGRIGSRNFFGGGHTAQEEMNYQRSNIEESGSTIVAAPSLKGSTSLEEGPEIINDILEHGADAIVFMNAPSVDHFFKAVGYEAASEALDHCIPVATNYDAANALTNKNIGDTRISTGDANEDVCELLLNLFPGPEK